MSLNPHLPEATKGTGAVARPAPTMGTPNPILKFFNYTHLPSRLQAVAEQFYDLAHCMNGTMPDSAEKFAGMRKLLEAKDCFVRAAME
jgi:hypothetical protein